MLVVKSFTAIASSIIPKTLRITLIPDLPIALSIIVEYFRTIYTKNKFNIIPIIIFIVSNSAFRDSIDVKLPAPAINGNAKGTIEAVSGSSSLKSDIPRIISKAKKKNINDPATAKELTSIPIKFKMDSPTKRKAIIIIPETTDAFSD